MLYELIFKAHAALTKFHVRCNPLRTETMFFIDLKEIEFMTLVMRQSKIVVFQKQYKAKHPRHVKATLRGQRQLGMTVLEDDSSCAELALIFNNWRGM